MPSTRKRIPGSTRALALAAASLASAAAMAATVAGSAQAAGVTATIDGAQTFQTIAGFGASEAFGQAQTLMSLPAQTRQIALDLLFSPTNGAGLDIVRNEIGDQGNQTIEPNPPAGGPSGQPHYQSLEAASNDIGQLSLAKAIKAQYGVTNFFADAWTPPAYMKDNNSVAGQGSLCGAPGAKHCASGDWRQAFANYLVQYARDYYDEGIPLSYIGFENEANLPVTYEDALMDPAQTADFIHYIGPALAASGLPTKLECCATEGSHFAATYSAAIKADPGADRWVPLFTSHSYTTNPTQDPLFSPVPGWDKPVWQTEWSTFETWDPAWDDGSAASGLTWAQNIYKGLAKANLSADLYWLFSGTPLFGNNQGLIMLTGDPLLNTGANAVLDSGRLWAFANYSRFIHPGAVRIGASVSGAADADNGIEMSAYRNASGGSVVVVAINGEQNQVPVTFNVGGAVPDGTLVTPYLTDANTPAQDAVDGNTAATTGQNTEGQSSALPPINRVAEQPYSVVNGGQFTAALPARSIETFVLGYRN